MVRGDAIAEAIRLQRNLCKPLDPAMARRSGTCSLGTDNGGRSMTTLIEADVEQAARDRLEASTGRWPTGRKLP